MTDDHAWLLCGFVSAIVDGHQWPWKIEQDWTWEVIDASGQVVTKCQRRSQAEALIELAREIREEQAAIEMMGLDDVDPACGRKESA